AVSVDSVRNLPATALFGSSLIFFFILGAIFFLLPCALVSAELSSNDPASGGVYSWVKNAFGPQMGVFAIWMQWIENVIWYPTILSFVAGTIGFLISPALANNKVFLITVILVAFWGATLVNYLGIKSSALFSNFCAVAGLLLPMTLIIALGAVWLFSGKPLQISFTPKALLPSLGTSQSWVALTGIMLSFCGMEIATVHTRDVKDPQRTYPRAMLLATLVIVVTLICGALAIAFVLPEKEISLVAGIMEAFQAFFAEYHLTSLLPFIALTLVIGGMGSVSNWIVAPIRGLLFASQEGFLPAHFSNENRFGAPKILLLYQALIVTAVTMVFLLLPSINASYWFLTALAAQLYMLMYILMFFAAWASRDRSASSQVQGYRMPGGKWGIRTVCVAGIIGSVVTFIIGFIPPDNIQTGGVAFYESLLIGGLLIMSLPPFLIYQKCSRKLKAISLAQN
ncbi:MAG: amino acid permease, partial [Proteobacteria bacterium]|nr:amino acid permease [Pseudomonadota bacterium]